VADRSFLFRIIIVTEDGSGPVRLFKKLNDRARNIPTSQGQFPKALELGGSKAFVGHKASKSSPF
jgi:hypothetical protein